MKKIRERAAHSERQRDLSKEYQVSPGTMSLVVNRKRRQHVGLLFLVCCLPFLCGCKLFKHFVYVRPLMPVIEHPRKPRLKPLTKAELADVSPLVLEALQKRDARLKDYALRYTAVVEMYNEWAREQNEKSGYGRMLIQAEEGYDGDSGSD